MIYALHQRQRGQTDLGRGGGKSFLLGAEGSTAGNWRLAQVVQVKEFLVQS